MTYTVNICLSVLIITTYLTLTNDLTSLTYKTAFQRGGPGQLSKDSVLSIGFQEMPDVENFGPRNGWYWFEISICQSPTEDDLVLQIPTHNIGEIFVYKKVEDTMVFLGSNVASPSQKIKLIEHRFPTFQFNDLRNQETLYLSTFFQKESNFPVRVYAAQNYHEFNSRHQLFTGLYYGFLIAVILLNLFFFSEHREKAYLLYVIFLCSYSMAIMFQDGLMRVAGLHQAPVDLEAAVHWLTEITMFIFSFHFLNLSKHAPKFKWIAYGLVSTMLIVEVIYFISGQFIFFVIADSIAMASFLCTWVVTIIKGKNIKYAKFYIPGYSLLISLGIHHILAYDFGLFSNNGNTLFLKIAGTVDMIIFSYAISYRQRVINKVHDQLVSELRALINSYKDQNKPDPLYQLLEENSLTNQSLTLQEVRVLKYINQGMTNREIAEKLYVSYNTIKFHVRNIYQKLQVNNRQEVSEKLLSI